MLTKDQRTLLENVLDALDALDRLFDHESTATDVYALLVATAIALRGSELVTPFDDAARQLREVVRSQHAADRQRQSALGATDPLRAFVAEHLRQDALENPKHRH